MSISWSKKGVFLKDFLKKVIDMYYGENHDFLKKDIYGLRRMFFWKNFRKKVIDVYYGENHHFCEKWRICTKFTIFWYDFPGKWYGNVPWENYFLAIEFGRIASNMNDFLICLNWLWRPLPKFLVCRIWHLEGCTTSYKWYKSLLMISCKWYETVMMIFFELGKWYW